jgi:hypothetical protein
VHIEADDKKRDHLQGDRAFLCVQPAALDAPTSYIGA